MTRLRLCSCSELRDGDGKSLDVANEVTFNLPNGIPIAVDVARFRPPHDCSYISARNTLIPSAEKLAVEAAESDIRYRENHNIERELHNVGTPRDANQTSVFMKSFHFQMTRMWSQAMKKNGGKL